MDITPPVEESAAVPPPVVADVEPGVPLEQAQPLAVELHIDKIIEAKPDDASTDPAYTIVQPVNEVRPRMSVLRREDILLPRHLSEHELAQKATEASGAWLEVMSIEDELKAVSASLRSDIKEAKASHKKIMAAIESKTDERPTAIEDRLDWEKKMVITVRLDVAEDDPIFIVDRRSMTEAELQYPLQLSGDQSEAPAATPTEQLTQIAQVADGGTPPLTWHAKDGKLCKDPTTCKRRQHVTNPQVLKNAGIEPEQPPAVDAPATAEQMAEVLGVPAEEPLTQKDVEEFADALENVGKPADWRKKNPEEALRGRHADKSLCYVEGCEENHFDVNGDPAQS